MNSPKIEIIKKGDDKISVRILIQGNETWEKDFQQDSNINELINDFKNGTGNEFPNEILDFWKNQRNEENIMEQQLKNLVNKYEEKNLFLGENKISDKIGKPLNDPFCVFTFIKKDKILKMLKLEGKELYGLEDYGPFSAYCNGINKLFISGGEKDKKCIEKFWKIDLDDLDNIEIEQIAMLPKKNHSMISIPGNYVFIVGGQDKETFYYDHESGSFNGWKELNRNRTEPALILVNNYLYCFDNINTKDYANDLTFEKTDLNSENHIWELIQANISNMKVNQKFFGVVQNEDDIIFIGGNMDLDNNELNKGSAQTKNYKFNLKTNMIEESEIPFIELNLKEKTFLPYNNNISYIFPDFNKNNPEVIFFQKNKNQIKKVKYESQKEEKLNDLPPAEAKHYYFDQPLKEENANNNKNINLIEQKNDDNQLQKINSEIEPNNKESVNELEKKDIEDIENVEQDQINKNSFHDLFNFEVDDKKISTSLRENNMNINTNKNSIINDQKNQGNINIESSEKEQKEEEEKIEIKEKEEKEEINGLEEKEEKKEKEEINGFEEKKEKEEINGLEEKEEKEEIKEKEEINDKDEKKEKEKELIKISENSGINIDLSPVTIPGKISKNGENENNINSNNNGMNENVEKSQNENKINNEAQQEKKEDINIEIKPPEINKIQPKIKENIITHTEGQKKNGFDYYSSGIILGKDDKKNTNVKIEGDVNAPKPNIENVDVNLNKSNPSQKVEIKDPNIEANINKKDNENIKAELKDEKLKDLFHMSGIIVGTNEKDPKILKYKKDNKNKDEIDIKGDGNINTNLNPSVNIPEGSIKLKGPTVSYEEMKLNGNHSIVNPNEKNDINIKNENNIDCNINPPGISVPNPNVEFPSGKVDIKVNSSEVIDKEKKQNTYSNTPELKATDIITPMKLPGSTNENVVNPFKIEIQKSTVEVNDQNMNNPEININAQVDKQKKTEKDFKLSGIIYGNKDPNYNKNKNLEIVNKSDINIKAPKIDINGNIVGSNNIDDSKVNAKSPNQTFEKNINQNQINLNKDKTEEKYDFIIQGVIQPNKDKNKNNKKNENIKINGNSNTDQKNLEINTGTNNAINNNGDLNMGGKLEINVNQEENKNINFPNLENLGEYYMEGTLTKVTKKNENGVINTKIILPTVEIKNNNFVASKVDEGGNLDENNIDINNLKSAEAGINGQKNGNKVIN